MNYFLGIPLFFLLTGFGEIQANGWPHILISLMLSIYHIIMHAGALRVLGHFYIPGSGILQDHKLMTTGPFRYVRHPIFSAFIALWLASALGTTNWLLLALWPVYVALMIFIPIRQGEKLLYEKFGEEYISYTNTVGKIIPKFPT